MDRRRRRKDKEKEKLGLRSSEELIHSQESQVINCIEEAALSSMPDSDEKNVVIETPHKLKALRTKSVTRHKYTNFQQLAR